MTPDSYGSTHSLPDAARLAPTSEQDGNARKRSQTSNWKLYHPLLFCVLIAWAIRLLVTLVVYKSFLTPGRDHWEFGFEIGKIAESLATGHGFSNPYWGQTGPTAMITPVYPYLLSAVFLVFGVHTQTSALVILCFNGLVSALTCIPIYFIASRNFGHRVAKTSVWIWAVFPYAIYFSAACMWYHSLLALLLTTSFLVSLELESASARRSHWIGLGLLSAVSALVSPVALAALPVLLGWPCYRRWRQGSRFLLPALLAGASLASVLSPWMVRNCLVFQQPVFLKDNFWMEVAVGNVHNSLHWWDASIHPAGNATELSEFNRLGELGYMSAKRDQALRFIGAHPALYFCRSIRRAVFMWTGFWSFQPAYLRQEPLDLWNIFFCSLLSTLVATGFLTLYRRSIPFLPFAALMALFPAVYYFTHPDIAYRLPLDPEALILASCSLASKTAKPYTLRTAVLSVIPAQRRTPTLLPLLALAASLLAPTPIRAQSPSAPVAESAQPASTNTNRILGIIPDFQTVRDSNLKVSPLTTQEKWKLVWKNAGDPFNFANVALNSGLAEFSKNAAYGHSFSSFAERAGAGTADLGLQSVVSGGVLASVLRQDPRYFRKGPSAGIASRAAYSIGRIIVARQDSGSQAFNATGVFGMFAGIGASNLYYPRSDRTLKFMANRLQGQLLNDVVGNLLSEFWPDIQHKFFRLSRSKQN